MICPGNFLVVWKNAFINLIREAVWCKHEISVFFWLFFFQFKRDTCFCVSHLAALHIKGTLKPKLHLNNNLKLFRNIRYPCVPSLLPNNLVLLSWMSQRNLIHMSFFFVISSLAIRSHKLNYISAPLFLLVMKEISKKPFKESLGREDGFSDGGSSTTGTLIRWNRVLMLRRWHNLLPSSLGLTSISAAAEQYHIVGPGCCVDTGWGGVQLEGRAWKAAKILLPGQLERGWGSSLSINRFPFIWGHCWCLNLLQSGWVCVVLWSSPQPGCSQTPRTGTRGRKLHSLQKDYGLLNFPAHNN